MIEDAHAEAECPACHRSADPTEAEDADGLAVDVEPPQEIPLPLAPLALTMFSFEELRDALPICRKFVAGVELLHPHNRPASISRVPT